MNEIKKIAERANVNVSVVALVIDTLVEIDTDYCLENNVMLGGPIQNILNLRNDLLQKRVLEKRKKLTSLNNVLEVETKQLNEREEK